MAYVPPRQTVEVEWNDQQDYNRAFMNMLQREVASHWKFMHYLKTHYPEALAEWNALNKIAES